MNLKKTKSRVSLVVTDLDNTLWDWFDSWYASFDALLTGLTRQTGIPRAQLEKEAREVHQRRGTTEYSWLLYEMPSIIAYCGTEDPFHTFSKIRHQQNSARLNALKLYPGVARTLLKLKHSAIPIVGYTESQSYWTRWRIQKTELDGTIDCLYSSPDHEGPADLDPREKRFQPDVDFALQYTQHRYVA